jgi:iron complex transport system ATP-binding protein
MTAEPLAVQEVTYRYPGGDWQLGPASFRVAGGEIVGIIGPNGSGKSTLLKAAARVLTPASGKVLLSGRDAALLSQREVARQVGYLPQAVQPQFDYQVWDVVALGRYPHLKGAGFLTLADVAVVERCLAQTETGAYSSRFLRHLSGGERQRVLLASVLAQEPRVLLLDEPTSAMDLHHQVRLFGLLSDLAGKGLGAAIATHDLNLASLFSDRILLLSQGRVAHEGRPEEILREDILRATYGEGLEVRPHPVSGRPLVFPSFPGAGAR